jgi:hypothetical protein
MAKRGSAEWKENIRKSRLGCKVWNKGKTGVYSEEVRKKMGIRNIGKPSWNKGKRGLSIAWNRGIHWSDEIKIKISKAKAGKPNFKNRGSRHYAWKGGITELNEQIRQSLEYRLWRKAVFERDGYTCVKCGIKNEIGLGKTVKLEADHIKQFAMYPDLRYDLDNGRTLCIDCHHRFGSKERKIICH